MSEPQLGQATQTSAQNHELLILIGSKVDAVAVALEKSITHNAEEVKKLWEHGKERDRLHSAALQGTTDKLASSIERVAEKQNSFGKPNISTILSVCVFIGSIAVAFIAPIKADIERSESARSELAKAVLVKEEKIQALQTNDMEFREKQKALIDRVGDVESNGSAIIRERVAVIENDLKWMRGEKATHQKIP